MLSSFAPSDRTQERLRQEYLAYLADKADAMSRTCQPAHLTASALVLDPFARRVLLTLHPKVGRWLQLGGHCEPDDASLRTAAEREAMEESGLPGLQVRSAPLRLDRHAVRCGPDGLQAATHLDVQYVVHATCETPLVPSPESPRLRWWPVDELPPGTDDSVRALVRAAS